MNQVLTIAAASVREHSRRKLILFFLVTSFVVAGGFAYVTVRGLDGPMWGLVSFYVNGFMATLALVAALAVSMGNIGRPFGDGEASMILARPVARWQYAAGRLLAGIAVIGGLCALMAVELQIVRLLSERGPGAGLWQYWAVQWFNLTVIAAIATLLSTLMANPILVAILTYFIDKVTGTVTALHRSSEIARISTEASGIVRFLWYVTPKQLGSSLFFQELGINTAEAGQAIQLLTGTTKWIVVWATAYLIGVVLLTMVLVGRKEV